MNLYLLNLMETLNEHESRGCCLGIAFLISSGKVDGAVLTSGTWTYLVNT